MERIFNFSAGPATLPVEVLEEASEGLKNYQKSGMGVIEMSHRSKQIDHLREESEDLVKRILNLGDEFEVLFLQGGASLQFTMVPMNFLTAQDGADYVITGSWSKKALKEAKLLNENIKVVWSSEESNFNRIPHWAELETSRESRYIHITSNNTIFGTQFQEYPAQFPVPIVADMSSDMLCKPFNPGPFGLIYAGAQKNLGPAGVVLVIVRKDFLEQASAKIPSMLQYKIHAENSSMYNTPPVFGMYVMNLVMKWIENNGGLDEMERRNRDKAQLLYDVIDHSEFYIGHAEHESRSIMNATWNLANKNLEKQFLEESQKANLDGLKGHRSVGGFRASIYNAMPLEGCKTLAEFMRDFAQKNG